MEGHVLILAEVNMSAYVQTCLLGLHVVLVSKFLFFALICAVLVSCRGCD